MKTQTAPRPLAENTTHQTAVQTQRTTPRKARTSPARQSTGKTPTNPLQGLFSDDELALIDQRCKAMGRNVVEVVVSALRNWVMPGASYEDSHLENDTPAKAEAATVARLSLAIFGEEIACTPNDIGHMERIYFDGTHFHFIFELEEYLQDGKWLDFGDWSEANPDGSSAQFKAFIDSLPAERVGLKFCYDKSFNNEEIAEWFDEYDIPRPAELRQALRRDAENEMAARAMLREVIEADCRERMLRKIHEALAA